MIAAIDTAAEADRAEEKRKGEREKKRERNGETKRNEGEEFDTTRAQAHTAEVQLGSNLGSELDGDAMCSVAAWNSDYASLQTTEDLALKVLSIQTS